jgi:hypothetical protein
VTPADELRYDAFCTWLKGYDPETFGAIDPENPELRRLFAAYEAGYARRATEDEALAGAAAALAMALPKPGSVSYETFHARAQLDAVREALANLPPFHQPRGRPAPGSRP